MNRFARWPLKKTLRYGLMTIAQSVFLLVLLMHGVGEFFHARESLVERLSTLVEVVGSNAESSRIFDDETVARKMAESLATVEDVESAFLMSQEGQLVASYYRSPPVPWGFTLSSLELPVTQFTIDTLHLYQPLFRDERLIGAIYLQANLHSVYGYLLHLLYMALAAVVLSGMLVLWLSKRLESFLIRPIKDLANLMGNITRQQRYDQYIYKMNEDEVGELYDGFNRMMQHINERDQRLLKHQEALEQQVEERTQALTDNLQQLQIAEQSAQDAARSKGIFLATMSHEIRTPMNGILGMLTLLEDTSLDTDQRDYLDTINTSATALLGVIDDVLDFSKIDANKMELESTAVDVTALGESICSLLSTIAHEKSLGLSFETHGDIPQWLSCDPLRLRQVLTNLVGNAVKFTEQGSVVLSITVQPCEANSEGAVSLTFAVQDSGVGISQQAQRNIFEEFAQADDGITRQYGGTGLGLAISQKIVEKMGGKLEVESELGKGARFFFTVQLSKAEPPAEQASKPLTPLPSSATILLVEDNVVNQKVARKLLNKLGLTNIEIAADGQQGVEAFNKQPPSLILMDCQMPVMSGYDATAAIRVTESAEQHIPIIAMTANATAEERERCLTVGMNDYLAKPVTLIELHSTLQRWLTPDALIDEKALNNIAELMGEAFTELLDAFVHDSEQRLQEMKDAHAQGDIEQLSRAAHTLKSSAANIGAVQVSALAEQLENMTDDVQPKVITDRLKRLHVVLTQTIEQLRCRRL